MLLHITDVAEIIGFLLHIVLPRLVCGSNRGADQRPNLQPDYKVHKTYSEFCCSYFINYPT